MKTHLRSLLFLFLGCFVFFTSSSLAANGLSLVNAASYETTDVNGTATGVVAPGSLASLFSINLATQVTSAPTFPLPKTLDGVSVKVNGIDCPLLFVSQSQINLQVPSSVTAGTVTVEVYRSGAVISNGNVIIADAAPGVFTYNATGQGQAAAQNSEDYSINSDFEAFPGGRPEAGGKYVTIYATGMGKPTIDVADGTAAPGGNNLALANGVTTVTIGGVVATVSYSGLAPGFAGLWQLNAIIPESLPTNMTTGLLVALKGRQNVKSPTLAVANKNEFAQISGSVLNALTGNTLAGADLALTGNGKTRTAKSSGDGKYSFYALNGSYSLTAGASGFITAKQDTSLSGTQNVNFALTAPLASSEQYRIVLSWNSPLDLDAHLTGPLSSDRFHVWWNGETDIGNAVTTAQFNRDDTTGVGPETLTFTVATGSYRFSVQNYTDRDYTGGRVLLSSAGAIVRVYRGSEQVAVYTAPGGAGTLWKVFEVINGQLTAVNTLSDEPDPSNIKTSY